ncbi:hypothetical protein [Kibdelosporangium philippinense]|uniref:hypothetical protein n=1 Tax=Kibdelosporangium philippinense TaxID=211113 RepID=UPI00360FC6F9
MNATGSVTSRTVRAWSDAGTKCPSSCRDGRSVGPPETGPLPSTLWPGLGAVRTFSPALRWFARPGSPMHAR